MAGMFAGRCGDYVLMSKEAFNRITIFILVNVHFDN